MLSSARFLASSLCAFVVTSTAYADVLICWDQPQVPSRDTLGVSTLVVPIKSSDTIRAARAQGYSVYLEVEAATLATAASSAALPAAASDVAGVVVKGSATRAQLALLRQRFPSSRTIVRTLDERGKWPHIRSNWVTNNNGVLQVSSRTAQPWIENNAALIRIAQAAQPNEVPLLTYKWEPITIADKGEGPSPDDYLVAIAEAGSFGADLVLPLHARFQRSLLLGLPAARDAWREIRTAMRFYAENLPSRYRPIATIGVVTTTDPMRWFEVMNLLARHNLSFVPIATDAVATRDLAGPGLGLSLLIVLDAPGATRTDALIKFADNGGTVVFAGFDLAGLAARAPWRSATPIAKSEEQTIYPQGRGRIVEVAKPIANPDEFAEAIGQLLARDQRALQLWNGITVLMAPYAPSAPQGGPETDAGADTVLVTALNYTHQKLPVQVRVRGSFSAVHYESPDEELTLLPYQSRDGFTEFVLPALRIGARVFLTKEAGAK